MSQVRNVTYVPVHSDQRQKLGSRVLLRHLANGRFTGQATLARPLPSGKTISRIGLAKDTAWRFSIGRGLKLFVGGR